MKIAARLTPDVLVCGGGCAGLVASQVENLLVAGRCHSATAEAASSTRVSVTAMGMGQAAGTAAALAVRGKTTVAELDGQQVRRVLESQGAGPFTDE